MAEIYNFTFSKEHNNDQGVYNRSFIKSFLSANNLTLLADGAYSDSSLITPRKPNQKRLDNEQKQERSFVEIVIGYVKNWKAAEHKFKHNTEIQVMALWVIYQLAAWKLQLYPIRK